MTLHVCTPEDMEASEPTAEPFGQYDAREWMLGAVDMMAKVAWYEVGLKPFREMALLIAYAHHHGRMTSRGVKPLDIEHMVSIWVETVVGLSTRHTHAEYTEADHTTDDLLGPLLTAPIKDIRAFATRLGKALEADERVPFMVWSGFQRVVLPILEQRPDGEVIALKKDLAAQVAELAEKGLDRGDLVQAMAGALQWRSPEALTKVKGALEAGEKPRIKGRESCLFLEVAGERVVL